MNKTILTGRLTKDPEVKYNQQGMAILGFVLAVDRQQKDANGQRLADFISCKAFSGQADFISKYCHKGNMLGITGRIMTGSFKAQDGSTKYTTDVVVETVENLTPRETSPQPQNHQKQNTGYTNQQYNQPQQNQGYQQPYNPGAVSEDDVPF